MTGPELDIFPIIPNQNPGPPNPDTTAMANHGALFRAVSFFFAACQGRCSCAWKVFTALGFL